MSVKCSFGVLQEPVKHFAWGKRPQGYNLNEIGGTFSDRQRNMWLNWIKRLKSYQPVEETFFRRKLRSFVVVHGYRKSESWDVLGKTRNENCPLSSDTTFELEAWCIASLEWSLRKFEAYVKSSRPFWLGCTRVAMVEFKRNRTFEVLNFGNQTFNLSTDWFLQLEIMTKELQVIV